MKKHFFVIIGLLMVLTLIGCTKQPANTEIIGTVTVNSQGKGQVSYAMPGEEPVFNHDDPVQSLQVNVFVADHYTFAAEPDEGWKFQHWLVNGDLFSQEPQVELYVDHNIELEAVFTTK